MNLRQVQYTGRGFVCSSPIAQELLGILRIKRDNTGVQNKRTITKQAEVATEQNAAIRKTPEFRIATWDISGLGDKTTEIVEYMIKHKITIMGVADTRRKGQGIKKIHKDFIFTWRGTQPGETNKHGVGFVIAPAAAKYILEIEYTSERIIHIRTVQG
uniref:Uncharacterized protein n=2 Tax=Arion vulgaris TaxID=1028688 RepID=A0A0B7B812_9EUPU